jgi:hypothetical protein
MQLSISHSLSQTGNDKNAVSHASRLADFGFGPQRCRGLAGQGHGISRPDGLLALHIAFMGAGRYSIDKAIGKEI